MKALKWIGGCLGIGLLLVLGVCWFGYKQMKNFAGEGTPTVVIHAPAKRVFGFLANADSLTEWRNEGLGIRASRKGLLRAGDTVVMQARGAVGNRLGTRAVWVVRDVQPNTVVVMEMLNNRGVVMAQRRDSLVDQGDSTTMLSVVDMLTSRSGSGDSASDTSGGLAGNMMRLGMRAQLRMEQSVLRAFIQGDSLPPRPNRQ